jgi:ribosomal protein L37AE/L43A
MKYLKKFNESSLDFINIIGECKDILLELSDKDIKYKVYGHESAKILGKEVFRDIIRVEIGDESTIIKMIGMDLMFEHLFSYMESEGFKLNKDSYYENDSWEYYEACPECNSENIKSPDDESMEGWKCNKCGHEGYVDDFQRPEHPLDKSDLFWATKSNYHIQFMLLEFHRPK